MPYSASRRSLASLHFSGSPSMTGTRCVFREHDRNACTIKHGLDPRRAFLMAAALHCERLEMTDRRGDCSTDSRRQRGDDGYEVVIFGVEIHRPVHRLRGCKIEGLFASGRLIVMIRIWT